MTALSDRVAALVSGLSLGEGHEDQERVVAAALRRLLVQGRRGVVLADEVGFGKTYEALAILSHLCADARLRGKQFGHALVLCKPALVRKWEEETSETRADRGFPRYLPAAHPARRLFSEVRCIDSRATADELRRSGLRGRNVDGRQQAPPGLYIVNERNLQEEKRGASRLLAQIWRTKWDVVIVDEAHHYARGNKPMRLFAPDEDLTNYEQPSLDFDKILALTATPFELTPSELVSLLALIRADQADLRTVGAGLTNFVKVLDRFFELRERPHTDSLRQQHVAALQRLRDEDCLNEGRKDRGLQSLLRRFLIRNTKRQNERRYFLVERGPDGLRNREFRKLDESLQAVTRASPLIPFLGEHALFYLELRDVIQEVTERARDRAETRTFIPTDLRQGLSSYRQIEESALLHRDFDGARRLRSLVERWNASGKLHPKVAAVAEMVGAITAAEIQKIREVPDRWLSKVLIFNKLIGGTAPQLTDVLTNVLRRPFDEILDELLGRARMTREGIARRARHAVDRQLDVAERELKADPLCAAWSRVPDEFEHDDFVRHRGQSMLRVFREPLRRRAVQPLSLIDLARSAPAMSEDGVEGWIRREITGPAVTAVRAVMDRYRGSTPDDDDQEGTVRGRVEWDLVAVLEESKSVGLVGRFDGEKAGDRETHRRNFNRRHNPFVLLVGQVGEEGIDLQEQCRYVVHYDLEWNPARMEQREGRVDRLGWGRASEGYIDVRFMLLKGTYEERIFHTVMQRDQWFQILIGSKRRELGELPENGDAEVEQDAIEEAPAAGVLTELEKSRVMLDLQPESVQETDVQGNAAGQDAINGVQRSDH